MTILNSVAFLALLSPHGTAIQGTTQTKTDDEPGVTKLAGASDLLKVATDAKLTAEMKDKQLVIDEQGKYKYSFYADFSSDNSYIYLKVYLTDVSTTSTANSRALLDLLVENTKNRFYFSIYDGKDDKGNPREQLYANVALANRSIAPTFLKTTMDNFAGFLDGNVDKWSKLNDTSTAAPNPK